MNLDKFNIEEIAKLVRNIISSSGDDPQRDGLNDTPERVAKLYKNLLSGYSMKIEEVTNNSLFSTTLDDMIVIKNIEFNSLCEHDLTPSALDSIISPHGLGVVIEAKHSCSILRGDNFSSSNLTTSSMHGSFRSNLNTRQEFLSHIQNNT